LFLYLVILFVIVLILATIYVLLISLYDYLLLLFPILSNKSIQKLEIISPFYRSLSNKEKKEFRKRVAIFITLHQFIPKENTKITKEIKIMIASIAVMISFRFRNSEFLEFDKILIYPKHYYSHSNDNFHKGETNPYLKTIVFSLEDFKEGIAITNDNINLGIHEFTHALHLIMQRSNTKEAFDFIAYFDKIISHFSIYGKQIREANYIRDYAFTDEHELLAVITENYFETPIKFKEVMPEVFYLLNKMYKAYN